jgi:hypothetical protein
MINIILWHFLIWRIEIQTAILGPMKFVCCKMILQVLQLIQHSNLCRNSTIDLIVVDPTWRTMQTFSNNNDKHHSWYFLIWQIAIQTAILGPMKFVCCKMISQIQQLIQSSNLCGNWTIDLIVEDHTSSSWRKTIKYASTYEM